jgi:tyrosine-protein kinase Etk/Wzc
MNSNPGSSAPNNNSQSYNVPVDDDSIDLRRYFGLFLSNWYWFALTLFCAGLLAYVINTYSERIYIISSSLLIKADQAGTDITTLEKLMPGQDIFKNQQNLQNEIGILKSYSLNFRVMKELPDFQITIVEIGRRGIAEKRHYKSAPFVLKFDSIRNQRTDVPLSIRIKSEDTYSIEINGEKIREKIFFGERFKENGFDFTINKSNSANFKYNSDLSNHFIFWFNKCESLANIYRGKLSVDPVNKDATLVTLSVAGVVPLMESEYLNKLMELYIRQGLENKNQTAENTIKFINEQLGQISDSLTLTENSLENFRLSNKIIDLSSEGAAIEKKLENYANEKMKIELQKQYYNYLAEYINTKNESGEIVSPSVMGVTDQLLIKLVDELANLQAQKKQLNYNFTGDQPAINLINSKIEDARIALNENVRNSILNTERTLEDIDERISIVERELNRLPGTERKLINIQRKYNLNNTVYTYMLEKRSEAGIAKASSVSNNRIIDQAEPFNSVRIKPREKRNYLLAILLGLIVPGLYIFLVDFLHNKILDKKDIERGTAVPIIGFVGHNTSKNEIPVFIKPGSSLAESFRSIRTNLKYYLNGEKKAVILITSTISGEGKTFISINLAAVFAMLSKKTLLVSLDLRKPRIDNILGSSDEKGLSSFLIGENVFDEIIQGTKVKNLFFVPSGSIPPNPSELIESERMKQFMKKAKEEFDYIILDTPPVGIVSDALLLGSYADMNIFVIRQKFSFKNTLELIQNIFEKKELKNLTIAVNDLHISGYYGYGLRYGYGFYEGYGYNYGYGQYGSYGHGNYHKYYTEE